MDELIGKHVANEAQLLGNFPRTHADKLADLMRELLESLDDASLR
jgi:hypothetical protein